MSIGWRRLLFAACLGAALVACTNARTLTSLDDRLTACARELRADLDGGRGAGCRAELADIAQEALSAARREGEERTKVSFYRVAAVASVEAGTPGGRTLPPAVDEGGAVCDRLPQRDASQPRDCTLLRLALPLGVGREMADRVRGLLAKRDAAGTPGVAKLPAADGPVVRDAFVTLETQTRKVGDVAGAMPRSLLPPLFVESVDADQRALYCWTAKTYSLMLDVQGESDATAAGLAQRKQALRQRVEAQVGPVDCRTTPTAVAVPQ